MTGIAIDNDLSPSTIDPDPVTVGDQPMTQRRVLGLATPIIGEQLLQTLVGAFNTLLVAKLGSAAVAGVGTSVEVIYFLISILIALEVGATVLVSQAHGAGEPSRVSHLARQSLSWGVILSIPVSVVGVLVAPYLIGLFGTEPDVAHNATVYLQIVMGCSIFLLTTFVLGAVFRGVGDSRTPLFASIAANIVNVVATWAFVFGKFGLPELGVAGAAVGATCGRVVSSSVMLVILLTGRRGIQLLGEGGWLPERETGRQLLRLGLPASLEQMLVSAGFTSMLVIVAMLGTSALAAQQIGFTALAIAFMPGFGFSIAATSLVGQSIGARNLPNAKAALRIAAKWGTIWMAVGGVIYFVAAAPIMGIFTDDPEVIDQGVAALRGLAIGLPLWAIWFVAAGGLRGTGDTRTPMISNVVATWLGLLLAWAGVRWWDAGLGWVWLTITLTAPLAAGVNVWALRKRFQSGEILPAGSEAVPEPAA